LKLINKITNKNMNREEKTYYCEHCGNKVKFIKDGGGEIICCGEPMREDD